MTRPELHASQVGELVERGVEMADDILFVVNPGQETIRAVVRHVSSRSGGPSIRLFVEKGTIKDVLDDFLIASRIADFVADDSVAVRTLATVPRTSLLLTPDTLVTLVEGGGGIAGLVSENEAFITATYEEYEGRWKRGDVHSLRTPPLSRVRETLGSEIGEDAVDDLETVLETLDAAPGHNDGLDEVTIALLVAANNRKLLYDISRWGEDINLASKATFSRAKNQLEDAGMIDTEKVPIEVGRPRLRLVLGNDDLRNADIDSVVEQTLAELG